MRCFLLYETIEISRVLYRFTRPDSELKRRVNNSCAAQIETNYLDVKYFVIMDLFDWMLKTRLYVSLMLVVLPAQKVAKCWI